MWKVIAVGVLAFSGTMITGVGVSNADPVLTPGNYPTQTACLNEGTAHGPNVGGPNHTRFPWLTYNCEQHNDGHWYLYLNTPGEAPPTNGDRFVDGYA